MDELFVSFQVARQRKAFTANITHMSVAEYCSTLMTVGWAGLGSRICLAKKYWQRVLVIFLTCLMRMKYLKKKS
jgi:hypothetical protein